MYRHHSSIEAGVEMFNHVSDVYHAEGRNVEKTDCLFSTPSETSIGHRIVR